MFVEIYGRLSCPYCLRAKQLAERLSQKLDDFEYEYTDMIEKGLSKEDIAEIIGRPVQTVPQILIDKKAIGGCTDFEALMAQQYPELI